MELTIEQRKDKILELAGDDIQVAINLKVDSPIWLEGESLVANCTATNG